MARYIDADALIERILKLKVVTDDMYGMGIARGIERAETAIQMQPTADVVPKHEVAGIFEEVEKIIDQHYNKHIFGNNDLEDEEKEAVMNFSGDVSYDIDKLKQKYTEGAE